MEDEEMQLIDVLKKTQNREKQTMSRIHELLSPRGKTEML